MIGQSVSTRQLECLSGVLKDFQGTIINLVTSPDVAACAGNGISMQSGTSRVIFSKTTSNIVAQTTVADAFDLCTTYDKNTNPITRNVLKNYFKSYDSNKNYVIIGCCKEIVHYSPPITAGPPSVSG